MRSMFIAFEYPCPGEASSRERSGAAIDRPAADPLRQHPFDTARGGQTCVQRVMIEGAVGPHVGEQQGIAGGAAVAQPEARDMRSMMSRSTRSALPKV